MSTSSSLPIVGADGAGVFSPEADICFGQFKASNPSCRSCKAPALVDSEIVLLNDLCKAATLQVARAGLQPLSASDVLARLQRGASVYEVFAEIMQGVEDVEGAAPKARRLMYNRFQAIKKKGYPVPQLPKKEELCSRLRST